MTMRISRTRIDLDDKTLQKPVLEDYGETVNALGDLAGGTDDIDLNSGNVVTATVSTSEETFTFSNPPASGIAGSFTFVLTNGGSQTVNWPASVDWAGGTAPTLASSGYDAASSTDDTATNKDNPLNASINCPANGVIIGCGGINDDSDQAFAWTNLTEDFDEQVRSAWFHSGASDLFEAEQTGLTITATIGSINANGRGMALASWGPA